MRKIMTGTATTPLITAAHRRQIQRFDGIDLGLKVEATTGAVAAVRVP